MCAENSINIDDLRTGLSELDRLAVGEFGLSLASILQFDDNYLAFKRLGRLSAVWVKYPFAEAHAYDPRLPTNWAQAKRFWEIKFPMSHVISDEYQSRFLLLQEVSQEWNRPIERIAEFNIFYFLSRRIRPIVCGDSKALKRSSAGADFLRRSGKNVSELNPDRILSVAAATFASYLVAHTSINDEHVPIITAIVLIIAFFGLEMSCKFLKKFEDSYDKKLDPFAKD